MVSGDKPETDEAFGRHIANCDDAHAERVKKEMDETKQRCGNKRRGDESLMVHFVIRDLVY